MTPASPNSWQELFTAPERHEQAVRLDMRLLRKAGRPFLLFPRLPRVAAATLDLYPAQTPRARAARSVLRCLLRASLPLGTERTFLSLSSADPFVKFLSSFAGEPTQSVPTFGILAGNPMAEGQRFLVLVFDATLNPVAAIKAGLSQRAKILIAREAAFLTAVPSNTRAVPRLRAQFESPRLRALALDFFPGDPPRPQHESGLPALLGSWVDPNHNLLLAQAPGWARLEQAAPAGNLFAALAGQLRGRTVHPAIHHGDFAPWNVKVSPAGAWTVLDWERGELAGIPAWDWFHYVIQFGILVGRLPIPALAQRVETLLTSDAFRQYASRADILGCERQLLLAYLLHAIEVIQPSEGLAATVELLKALSAHGGKP